MVLEKLIALVIIGIIFVYCLKEKELDGKSIVFLQRGTPVDYIVFDEYYRVINTDVLIKDLENLPEPKYYYRKWKFKNNKNWPGFRNGPVPYTGVKRFRFSSYYKSPRTTSERRYVYAHPEYVRPKRGIRALPNDWDDIPKGRRSRGWKEQSKKKRQWMK